MDRKDAGNVGAGGDRFYGRRYVQHARTETLPAVGGNADDFATTKPRLQRRKAKNERRILSNALQDPMQRINHSIAGYKDTLGRDSFSM